MRSLILAACAIALTACTTPQQRAERAQAEAEQMMVEYGPACSKLGYAAGADPWRDCVLRLHSIEQADRHASYFYGYGGRHWGLGGRWRP